MLKSFYFLKRWKSVKIGRLVNEKVLITFFCSMLSLLTLSNILSHFDINKNESTNKSVSASVSELNNNDTKTKEVLKVDAIDTYSKNNTLTFRKEVYNGMTMEELSAKLDKSLKSTLSGKGSLIANYSLERGVDPYLAVGIMLLETGCNWECSTLVKQCNNVGGQKGSPACMGSYRGYSTLDEGIQGFIDNLAINYYAQGLTTPEAMNSKYAESGAWAQKVRNYMNSISSK